MTPDVMKTGTAHVDAPQAPADDARTAAERALMARHTGCEDDIRRGVAAAVKVFEGDAEAFRQFCEAQYAPPGHMRVAVGRRIDSYLGALFGNAVVTLKVMRHGMDVDEGPVMGIDRLCGAFAPNAHVQEDLRASGIAAAIQLNFGGKEEDPDDPRARTPEEWLAINLSRIGSELVPAELNRRHAAVQAEAEDLVNTYNLYPGKIDFGDADIEFPEDLRLISHWGLRDYMTNLTGTDDPAVVKKQRAIMGLMERVARGGIPRDVLDRPEAHWDLTGETISVNGSTTPAVAEGDRRWRPFHEVFQVQKQIDEHTRRPNLIDTMFLEHRRMKEERVEAMLTQILASPLIGRIAKYVERRTGRPLEPYDIYFKRFQDERQAIEHLDRLTQVRYPTREALQQDMPQVLEAVGFEAGEAREIARHIRIDNARSAGHAWPPATDTDQQLLRVRVNESGVVWQEFGTFMHELGHCVEGVLSSFGMPYQLLWGVPNTAFSEAFAFTFQDLAFDVIGEAAVRDQDVEVLQRVWEAFEIAGPALVEMRLFRWLYDHPTATASEIHAAVQRIGDGLWAEYHAPVFGERSYGLMSVYSHMLWGAFYLAEYPVGYIIAYQVRRHLRDRDLATEMRRMCGLGDIFPDAWMTAAVGAPVSVEPMLEDAEAALGSLGL